MLRQPKTKLEIRGTTQTDPNIKVTLLQIATKPHQIYLARLLGVFVAHVCCDLIHISIDEGLRFEIIDAKHPVLDRIIHAMRLLECRASVHRELLDHEMI